MSKRLGVLMIVLAGCGASEPGPSLEPGETVADAAIEAEQPEEKGADAAAPPDAESPAADAAVAPDAVLLVEPDAPVVATPDAALADAPVADAALADAATADSAAPDASPDATVDTTGPTPVILAPGANDTTGTSVTLVFTVEEGASYRCRLDAAADFACASPQPIKNLQAGSHTLRVQGTDTHANVGDEASVAFVVAPAPIPIIDAPLAGEVTGPAVSVVFEMEPGVSYTCRMAGPAEACVSPYTPGPLAGGGQTIEVRGTDAHGLSGSATRSWIVQDVGPATLIAGTPAEGATTTSPVASFTFSPAEPQAGVTFECQAATLDKTFADCTSGWARGDLPDGAIVLTVRSRDRFGNAGPAATRAFTVDTTTPPTGHVLTVGTSFAAGATGTVSSNPAGIACPGDCQEEFADAEIVKLHAAATGASAFVAWSGDACDGSTDSTCGVTMTAARKVTASFRALASYTVTVSKTGEAGTHAISGGGVTCGSTCATTVLEGGSVVLTAAPDPGFGVTWSGCTSTSGLTCTVSPAADTTVTADFQRGLYTVTVRLNGQSCGGTGAAGRVELRRSDAPATVRGRCPGDGSEATGLECTLPDPVGGTYPGGYEYYLVPYPGETASWGYGCDRIEMHNIRWICFFTLDRDRTIEPCFE